MQPFFVKRIPLQQKSKYEEISFVVIADNSTIRYCAR